MFSPSSSLVGSEVGGWGSGSVRMIDVVRLVTTIASLLGFVSNVELMTATVLGLWGTWPG